MTNKIQYRKGNLLNVEKGIIAHGCNSRGVMGSGVAFAVKKKYPQAFDAYVNFTVGGLRPLGAVSYCCITDDLIIANAITQDDYGTYKRMVNYEAVAKAFEDIDDKAQRFKTEIHIPKIGAGLGGGSWRIIEAIIEETTTVPMFCWEL